MIVLVLGAVEGHGARGLDSICEGRLVGGSASSALKEPGVESTIRFAGTTAASTSRGDSVVL